MAELSDLWVNWTTIPRIIWVNAPRTELTVQDLIDTIRGVLEYHLDAMDDPTLISDFGGKQDLGGGTAVGLTLELNNAVVAFEARSTEFYDGYVSTPDVADAYGDTLIDAYATFITDEVAIGDLVVNLTDLSKATVLSVQSETELRTTPLAGGTTNKYNSNDHFDLYHVFECEVSGGNLVAVDYDGYAISQILPTFGTQVKVTAASSATISEGTGGATVEEIDTYLSANHGAGSWQGTPAGTTADAVWNELRSGHTISGSFGESIRLDSAGLEQSAIGEIDAYLSSIHGYTSWEGSGDPYVVAAAVWDEYRAGHTTPGTFGGDFSDAGATVEEIDAYLSSIHGPGNWEGAGNAGVIADAVWDEYRAGHIIPGTFGGDFSDAGATVEEIDAYLSSIHGAGNWEGSGNASAVAAAVWDEYLSAHQVSGSAGRIVSDGYNVSSTIYTDITALAVQVTRVLGLEHENAFIDNTTYDDDGQLLSSRVRIFDSRANAEAAEDGGSETTGLIATYTVEAEYESVGKMKFYRMVKQ